MAGRTTARRPEEKKSQNTKGYCAQTNRQSNIVIQQNKTNKHFNSTGGVNHLEC